MSFPLIKNILFENALLFKYRIHKEDLPLLKLTIKSDEVNPLIFKRLA